jgi:hypothetical protein
MLPGSRLTRRLLTLERWGSELCREEERRQQRRDELGRAVLTLFEVFPEGLHEQLLAFGKSDAWEGSGATSILLMIERGFWKPVPIPAAAAAAFLADPAAEPDARCDRCRTLLPYRGGMWTNTTTGQSWQAPLCYLRCCACGGDDLRHGRA